jgi:hypothetical protein
MERPTFPANIWDDTEVVPPGLADAIRIRRWTLSVERWTFAADL